MEGFAQQRYRNVHVVHLYILFALKDVLMVGTNVHTVQPIVNISKAGHCLAQDKISSLVLLAPTAKAFTFWRTAMARGFVGKKMTW